MINLHATDLRTYLECRRQFYFSKVLRVKPKNQVDPEYFDFGTKGHLGLKAYYSGEDPYEAIKEACKDNSEHAQFLKVLTQGYISKYGEEDSKLQIKAVEHTFSIDYFQRKKIRLYFTFDLLTSRKIFDHKFYKMMPDEKNLEMDFQASFYLWAARQMGLTIETLTFNCIKKTAPVMPSPLKNGGLSKAQATLSGTTFDLYLEAIKGYGLSPGDYEAELNHLKYREDPFFKRFTVRRSKSELDEFERGLRHLLREIHSPANTFIPIPSWDCKKCPYFDLCKAKNQVHNYDNTLRFSYEKKEDDER